MVIGITGQFSSGKSTVARMLAKRGAKVIDVDSIGHGVLENNRVRSRLADYFGGCITNKSGSIDRKKLAAAAFSSSRSHKALCRIVHPALANLVIAGIKKIKSKNPKAVILIDAAVLIEMGLLKYIDKLIVVKIKHNQQIKRARLKWGLSAPDINRRIRLQIPLRGLVKKADFIIDNSGSLKNTEKQVECIWLRCIPSHCS